MICVSCLSLPPRWPCCPGRWATGSPGCEHIGLSESALRLWQRWEASSQIQAPVFLLQQHLGTMTSSKHAGRKLLGKRANSRCLTLALRVTEWFSKQLIQAVQAWGVAFQGETDWATHLRLICLKGVVSSVPLRNPVSNKICSLWHP